MAPDKDKAPGDDVRELIERMAAGVAPEDLQGVLGALQRQRIDAVLQEAFATPTPTVGRVPDRVRGFRVRLDLIGAKPPVWRRLELPGDLTLPQVHTVIQVAMGWTDSHLHRFLTGRDHRAPYFITGFDLEEGEEGVLEDDIRLDQVVTATGDKLWYDYDFGDGWEHVLAVEAVLDEVPDRPACLAGRLACPPEDCGGLGGYGGLAAWVREGRSPLTVPPQFESADQALRWLPPDWHPDEFSVEEVNAALAIELAEPIPVVGDLAELVHRLERRGIRTLRHLLSLPVWTASVVLSDDDLAHMVEPYAVLLDLLQDGVKLTGAGYLPPSLVEQLAERTGVTDSWIGKANREDQTYPIHLLRVTAQALGLVAVRKGVIRSAPALRQAVEPRAIWQQIVSRLPLGREDFSRHVGWTTLVVAGSGVPAEDWVPAASDLLADLGWRAQDEHGLYPPRADGPTVDVLGILAGRLRDWRLTGELPAVAATARAAVLANAT